MQQVQRTTHPDGSIIQNRYKIDSLLGKGGFSAVYLVHDTRMKSNQFALKEVIDPKRQDRAHFLFEGEVLKRLDHTALPRVYRVFEDEASARVYLLMDYIEGPNLDRLRRVQPQNRFALPDALRLIAPIVEAVTYLHNQKPPIIHRDIKPANIIVPSNGEGPMLVDFGVAKEYDSEETTTAVRKLSLNYSAPEHYSQGTNPRTDIYGIAATLYALLAGSPPIDALDRLTSKGETGIDPLKPINFFVPSIPDTVAQTISRAMALDSEKRFPSIEAFWQALQPETFIATSPAPVKTGKETRLLQQPAILHAAAVTSPDATKLRQSETQRSAKRRTLLPLFALLALLAMLFGVLFSASYLTKGSVFHTSASTSTSPTQSHTSSTPAAGATVPSSVISTRTPTAAATMSPAPTPTTTRPNPTPTPGYPSLDSQYVGGIHNTPGNIDGTMTLTNIRQSGSNVSGTLILTNGLSGTAAFTNGTVTNTNTVQFLVAPYTQYPPLLFQGRVNADGSLSGTYCSAPNGQCDQTAGGYGTWRVLPPAPSSLVPSSMNFED